jgi:chemotaxis response regulator CheB
MAIFRTLVVTVAPLLADLVRDMLQPQLTLDIVGVTRTRECLAERLRALAPDLLLLGLMDSETDAIALPLLDVLPSAAILVLAPSGRHAWLYEMRPHRTVLADLSVAALSKALASRSEAYRSKG